MRETVNPASAARRPEPHQLSGAILISAPTRARADCTAARLTVKPARIACIVRPSVCSFIKRGRRAGACGGLGDRDQRRGAHLGIDEREHMQQCLRAEGLFRAASVVSGLHVSAMGAAGSQSGRLRQSRHGLGFLRKL